MRLDCPLCGKEMEADLTGSGLDRQAKAEWELLRDAVEVHWEHFCTGEEETEERETRSEPVTDMEMV
jgi:hypothetical protein